MKIPFFLVTGFLGSGKTTLLKKFLNSYADNKKIAVIQNEFAPASIDGVDLKQTGKTFSIMEVNKGSVFCVCLLSDFVQSLFDFITIHNPDVVILESSGLSDPIAIAEMLQSEKLSHLIYLSHVWCVIDIVNFLKIERMQTRLQHQVRIADTVILNKIDLLETSVDEVKSRIKVLNPYAKLVEATYCNTSLDGVFSEFTIAPFAIQQVDTSKEFESCGKPDVSVAIVKSTLKISLENLKVFLNEVSHNTYRLKGFVLINTGETIAVQSVFGKNELIEVENYSGPTELIAMGDNINGKEFNERFKDFAKYTNSK